MILDTALYILSGIISGSILGIIGAGSGIIAVVILVYLLNMPIHQAIVVAIFNTGVSALSNTLCSFYKKNLDLGLIIRILLPCLIFAPLGAKLSLLYDSTTLEILYSLLTIFVSFIMWNNANRKDIVKPHVQDLAKNLRRKLFLKYFIIGSITGLLSGLLGFSGGVIIVPGLVIFLHQPIKSATLNSIAIISITSLLSIISHVQLGNSFNLNVALPFSLGGIIGMSIGRNLQKSISGTNIKKLFSIFLMLLGTAILIKKLSCKK
ncbi:MAG: sulfite exporter TauE/SafE family protein [Rickettsiales bacterium]